MTIKQGKLQCSVIKMQEISKSTSHLIIDGWQCSKEKLESKDNLLGLLKKLQQSVNIDNACKPHIIMSEENSSEEAGFSIVALLPHGHLTIHTFPNQEHIFLDVFLDREFLAAAIIDLLVLFSGAKSHDVTMPKHAPSNLDFEFSDLQQFDDQVMGAYSTGLKL